MVDDIIYLPEPEDNHRQLTLSLSIDQRVEKLERRRDAHYRTSLNIQDDLINLRLECQEMLAIFKSIKGVLKFLLVSGKLLKWIAGVAVALYTLYALAKGNFKPTLWGE